MPLASFSLAATLIPNLEPRLPIDLSGSFCSRDADCLEAAFGLPLPSATAISLFSHCDTSGAGGSQLVGETLMGPHLGLLTAPRLMSTGQSGGVFVLFSGLGVFVPCSLEFAATSLSGLDVGLSLGLGTGDGDP